jgi:hypothetical protein
MGYHRHNKLLRIALVNKIVQQHYVEGVTTYKGIWEKYVFPVYPMSYGTFITYINTPIPKNTGQ